MLNNIISALSAITLGASIIVFFSQNRQTVSGQAVETSQINRGALSDDSTLKNPLPTTPSLLLPVTRSSVKSVRFKDDVPTDSDDKSTLSSRTRKKAKQQRSIQQQLDSFSNFYQNRGEKYWSKKDLKSSIYYTSLALIFKQVPCIMIQDDTAKLMRIASGKIQKAASPETKAENFNPTSNVFPVVINHLGIWKAMLIDQEKKTCYLLNPDVRNHKSLGSTAAIAAMQPYCHTDLREFKIRPITPPVPIDSDNSDNLTLDFLRLGLETMLDDGCTESHIDAFINTINNSYLQGMTASTPVASDQSSATTLIKEIDPQFKTVRRPTLDSLLQQLADKQSNTADVANNLKEFYGASFDAQDPEMLKTVINSLQQTKRRSG